jgi:glycosyltransferase involved in cell wall biosynthesis
VNILILNPLGGALNHYTLELADVLRSTRKTNSVLVWSIDEPSVSGSNRVAWVRAYLRALRKAKLEAGGSMVIVTWPVLGFLDLLILRILVGAHFVLIMHDTRPLVHSTGYGAISQRIGQLALKDRALVVHSNQARDDLRGVRLQRRAAVLAHPMFAPRNRVLSGERKVRVLGQYKRDRDIAALIDLAEKMPEIELEIVGRGWPEVAGWSVRNEFVTEKQLDQLISSSTAVLIPYKRFYQSGIAIRCMEHSVPVIGPANSSLADLLGANTDLLVVGKDWATAVQGAMNSPNSVHDSAQSWRSRAVAEWSAWLELKDAHSS